MSDALGINDNMMSLAAFPVIDDAVDQHLLIAIVPLRKQNILGAVSDTAPQGDIPRGVPITSMILQRSWGGGSISYLIDRLHRRVDRGIKPDCIIGAGNIQIDRARKTYRIDSQRG